MEFKELRELKELKTLVSSHPLSEKKDISPFASVF